MIDASVIEKYESGKSLAALSRELGISAYVLKNRLKECGVHIRNRNEQNKYSPQNQRKYQVNDNYFSEQSPNMAYLLGFYAADGSVSSRDNEIKLSLASVDRDFLEIIKKELNSTYPIFDEEDKKGYKHSTFSIRSNQIKMDLATYNIIPRKTYSFDFPEKLKPEYYIDFIRGYFDGDGSISTAGPSAIKWQLGGYRKDILQKVLNIFESYGIPKVSIQKRNNSEFYWIQYSNVSTRKIFDLLYYDGCFCLPRKYEKFKSLVK